MNKPVLAQGIACSDPQRPMLEIDLLFGRDIGGTLGVTEEQWSDFVAKELTPRFPQGLSAAGLRVVLTPLNEGLAKRWQR